MIEPLGHRVLIEVEIVEEITEGGIIIPQQTRDMEQAGIDRGTIIAIGATAWDDPRLGAKKWAQVGDKVCWARYAGKPIKDTDKKLYHLVNDEDLLARLE